MDDFILLVCGGREYGDLARVYDVLDRIKMNHPSSLIIVHGSAPGADTLAEQWAKNRQVEYRGYPAQWIRYKQAAGGIRNKRMRDHSKPKACVAFPGGPGTLSMCKLMREFHIEPYTVDWQLPPQDGDLFDAN